MPNNDDAREALERMKRHSMAYAKLGEWSGDYDGLTAKGRMLVQQARVEADRYYRSEQYQADLSIVGAAVMQLRPEHVCGLRGFGAIGDECPACIALSHDATPTEPTTTTPDVCPRCHKPVPDQITRQLLKGGMFNSEQADCLCGCHTTKPDDTTPETCLACGGTREEPRWRMHLHSGPRLFTDWKDGREYPSTASSLYAEWCRDTFHATPETSSTHLLGGFGASAEYDTDFKGEGGAE